MDTKVNVFNLLCNLVDAVREVPDKSYGRVAKSVVDYFFVIREDPELEDPLEEALFMLVISSLENIRSEYEKGVAAKEMESSDNMGAHIHEV